MVYRMLISVIALLSTTACATLFGQEDNPKKPPVCEWPDPLKLESIDLALYADAPRIHRPIGEIQLGGLGGLIRANNEEIDTYNLVVPENAKKAAILDRDAVTAYNTATVSLEALCIGIIDEWVSE